MLRLRSPIAAAALLFCALTVPGAHAEAPSVDAYAGQALVLGKPHQRSGTPSGSATSATGGQLNTTAVRSSGGSSAPAGPSGGPAASAPGSRPRSYSAAQAGGRPGQGGGHVSARPGGAPGMAPLAPAASRSSAFSWTDLLLAVAALGCLAAVAVLLRLSRRSGQPPAGGS